MKFIFLAGGFTGFAAATAAGYQAGRAPDHVFFDGAVGAVAGALLFRWFWSVLLHGLRETHASRQRAAAPASAATSAKSKP